MLKAPSFSMEFSCSLFFLGFVGNPRVWEGLIFASIRSACSLEIPSTQNPLPAAPRLELSSQKFKDLS